MVLRTLEGDQALAMLTDPSPAEREILGALPYQENLALLHSDPSVLPASRRAWASWNFLSNSHADAQQVCVTYWMNRLQSLPGRQPLFVTLNPNRQPARGSIHRSFLYDHPMFDRAATRAQRLLWNLQGVRRTWFCGAYFGHGFHEDGLQAGLAVAEQLGGLETIRQRGVLRVGVRPGPAPSRRRRPPPCDLKCVYSRAPQARSFQRLRHTLGIARAMGFSSLRSPSKSSMIGSSPTSSGWSRCRK